MENFPLIPYHCRVRHTVEQKSTNRVEFFYNNGKISGSDGFAHPRFVWIEKGYCIYKPTAESKAPQPNQPNSFKVSRGDCWFIPKGVCYRSHWFSENGEDICYHILEFEAEDVSIHCNTIQTFTVPEIGLFFSQMKKAKEENNNFAFLRAFYSILEVLIPRLHKSQPRSITRILPALRFIEENITSPFKVEDLAELCHLSTSHFYSLFHDAVGFSPIDYRNKIKVSRAATLLKENLTTEEVCDALNISSPSFLRKLMKTHLGKTPRQIKKEQEKK